LRPVDIFDLFRPPQILKDDAGKAIKLLVSSLQTSAAMFEAERSV
jgi:hypothetical protein